MEEMHDLYGGQVLEELLEARCEGRRGWQRDRPRRTVEMFQVICDRSYLRPRAQGFMRGVQNLSSQELRCLRSCRRQVLRWYSGGRDLIDTAVMRLAGQGTVRGDAEVDIVAGCCSRAFGTVKPFLEHVKLPHTVRGF